MHPKIIIGYLKFSKQMKGIISDKIEPICNPTIWQKVVSLAQ